MTVVTTQITHEYLSQQTSPTCHIICTVASFVLVPLTTAVRKEVAPTSFHVVAGSLSRTRTSRSCTKSYVWSIAFSRCNVNIHSKAAVHALVQLVGSNKYPTPNSATIAVMTRPNSATIAVMTTAKQRHHCCDDDGQTAPPLL